MHDTLEVFGARLREMRELWRNVVAPKLHARNAIKVSRAPEALFGELSDDIRQAAKISPERALSSEVIRAACRHGFIEVFVKS
jgi:hypothetical protein